MRQRTLAGVCSVLALTIVLAMGFFRVKTPHNIPFFIIYLLAMPLLLLPLTAVNKRLLAWRKARGRDIEDEEKYKNRRGRHHKPATAPGNPAGCRTTVARP